MPSPEQVQTAVDAYVAAYQANDRDAFLDIHLALLDQVSGPKADHVLEVEYDLDVAPRPPIEERGGRAATGVGHVIGTPL